MNNPVNPTHSPQLSLVPPAPAQDQGSAASTSRPAAEVTSSKPTDVSATVRTEASSPSGPASPTAADFRLIIEESDAHHYVYTVVDRRTGDVVSQFPREEVLRLKDQPDYKAGDLYKGAV